MFRPETTRLDKQREELTTRIDKYEVAHNEDATIVSNQRFTVKEMKTLKERKDDLTYNIRKQERRITKSLQRAKEAERFEQYKSKHGSEMDPEKNSELARVLDDKNRFENRVDDPYERVAERYFMKDGPLWLYQKYKNSKDYFVTIQNSHFRQYACLNVFCRRRKCEFPSKFHMSEVRVLYGHKKTSCRPPCRQPLFSKSATMRSFLQHLIPSSQKEVQ